MKPATRMRRQILLSHIGRHAKTATEIFEDFRYDYGSITERTLWRDMRFLVDGGSVRADGERCAGMLYTKVSERLPRGAPRGPVRCSLCDMPNTTSQYHPEHINAHARAAGIPRKSRSRGGTPLGSQRPAARGELGRFARRGDTEPVLDPLPKRSGLGGARRGGEQQTPIELRACG